MRVYADSKDKAFLLGHAEHCHSRRSTTWRFRNALRLGVFRSVITDEEANAAVSTIDADLRSGRLARVSVKWPSAFRAASRLSAKHSGRGWRGSALRQSLRHLDQKVDGERAEVGAYGDDGDGYGDARRPRKDALR
jgi:hypothetical protein